MGQLLLSVISPKQVYQSVSIISKFTIGEKWFDDYWMNYGKITITEDGGKTKQIRNLQEFISYRGGDERLIVPKARKIGLRRKYQ